MLLIRLILKQMKMARAEDEEGGCLYFIVCFLLPSEILKAEQFLEKCRRIIKEIS